jgi:hypothetical protein
LAEREGGVNFEAKLRAATLEGPGPFESKDARPTVPCRVAAVVWKDAQRRFERISTLIYVLLVLALMTMVAAVVFFFVGEAAVGAGAVSVVTGLVSGGLAAFIKDERDKAREARDGAMKIINDSCAGQEPDEVLTFIGV